jgi:hypothetical protein
VTAKTEAVGDDLLACVLGGVDTDVAKTLIELERAPVVREHRIAFRLRSNTGSSRRSSGSPAVRWCEPA